MMDRLRNRDLRTSINKCYSIYFDDEANGKSGGRVSATATAPRKTAKSKSPRKRDSCKDNCENELSAVKVMDERDNGNEFGVDKKNYPCEKGLSDSQAVENDLDNVPMDGIESSDNLHENNNNQKEHDDEVDNPRKRRLSTSSDASCGNCVDSIAPNASKRAKADSLKEQMFQVNNNSEY